MGTQSKIESLIEKVEQRLDEAAKSEAATKKYIAKLTSSRNSTALKQYRMKLMCVTDKKSEMADILADLKNMRKLT